MKLSKQQLEQLLQENRLVLSLIGMSNIGKSHWSKKLSNIGFEHIDCDNSIEEKLAPVLKELGYSGIEDVSRWMGQPYDERFPDNQQKYLSLEKEVMQDIFSRIEKGTDQNITIDTTGSVVHTDRDYCDKLKKHSLVIYIKATKDMEDEMFKRYIKEPKPVVFGNIFAPRANETTMQTLERCYKELLSYRNALYAEYADIIIPREEIGRDMDVNQFITLIKKSL